jgi:hypothetical protein
MRYKRRAVGFYRDEKKRVRPITARSSGGFSARPKVSVSKPKNRITLQEAREIHERRSERAKALDELLEARITSDYEKWAKAPNKWDIRGVDFFPAPTMPGDLTTNVKILAYATEQYYNKDMSNVKIYAYESPESFDKAYGKEGASQSYYAFANPSRGEVHFGPETSRLIRKGRLEDRSDFYAMSAVAHELGHLVGSTPTGTAFDEGSNEILAVRFTLHNLQMPRELRKELLKDPPHSYWRETRYAADTALLVNDGDKERAIDWLLRFKTSPYDTRMKMREEAERKLKRKYGLRDPFGAMASAYPLYGEKDRKKMSEVSEALEKRFADRAFREFRGENETWWARV